MNNVIENPIIESLKTLKAGLIILGADPLADTNAPKRNREEHSGGELFDIRMEVDDTGIHFNLVVREISYSERAVQAVYNIVVHLEFLLFEKSALNLLKHDFKSLESNFKSLDEDETWTPLIINDKTHQLGLLLHQFSSKLIHLEQPVDVFLASLSVPSWGKKLVKPFIRQYVTDFLMNLNQMSELIQLRLQFYETVFSGDQMSKALRQIKIYMDRQGLWDQTILPSIIELRPQVNHLEKESDPQKLDSLASKLVDLKQQAQQWHDKNLTLNLSAVVKATELYYMLVKQWSNNTLDEVVFKHVSQPFMLNGIKIGAEFREKKIMEALDESFREAIKLFCELEDKIECLQVPKPSIEDAPDRPLEPGKEEVYQTYRP